MFKTDLYYYMCVHTRIVALEGRTFEVPVELGPRVVERVSAFDRVKLRQVQQPVRLLSYIALQTQTD